MLNVILVGVEDGSRRGSVNSYLYYEVRVYIRKLKPDLCRGEAGGSVPTGGGGGGSAVFPTVYREGGRMKAK